MATKRKNGHPLPWQTPKETFAKLDGEFHFTLDAASSPENALCKNYFTAKDDGLKQSWAGHRVFVNCDYGAPIKKWVQKSIQEIAYCPVIVMFLSNRPDTRWKHDILVDYLVFLGNRCEVIKMPSYIGYIFDYGELRELKGRQHYELNGKKKEPAGFPSLVVVLYSKSRREREGTGGATVTT